MKIFMVGGVVFAGACAAQAQQQSCPALDRAHAAQILQADAQLQIEWRGSGDYTCHYSAAGESLDIAVAPYVARRGWPAYTAECSGPQKLAGTGDEAVLCGPRVLGHVRDTLFDVRLQLSPARQKETEDTLRLTAQRVAGNLF